MITTTIPNDKSKKMIADTGNVLRELFQHCQDSLPDEKMEWLANMREMNEMEAENIGDTLAVLATACQDKSTAPGYNQLFGALWGLSYRANALSAMMFISDEAEFFANKRKTERQPSNTPPKAD